MLILRLEKTAIKKDVLTAGGTKKHGFWSSLGLTIFALQNTIYQSTINPNEFKSRKKSATNYY